MVRYLFLILFISLSSGQLIDELEVFYNNADQFLFSPDSLVKNNGFWYVKNSDKPFTGRLKIYSKDQSELKIVECTIVDGAKNGVFMQYYDHIEQVRGVMGLYIDDRKEGTWTWIEPSVHKKDRSWESNDIQIITSIEYRDGVKHGSVMVYKADLKSYDYMQNYSFPMDQKVLQGRYMNGERTGDWYFYDNIFSDFDMTTEPKGVTEVSVHWSRKESYDEGMIFDSECREPWLKWIDCGNYQSKYTGKYIDLKDPEPIQVKRKERIKDVSFTIKDNKGIDVEIDIKEFYLHINQFHQTGDNIHKQGEHYFTVNDALRNRLKEKFANID